MASIAICKFQTVSPFVTRMYPGLVSLKIRRIEIVGRRFEPTEQQSPTYSASKWAVIEDSAFVGPLPTETARLVSAFIVKNSATRRGCIWRGWWSFGEKLAKPH